MELSELYQTRILELNRNPLNYGPLENASHCARGLDALCGDDLQIALALDSGGRVQAAAWDGQACAVTSASASMLTAWLLGRSRAELVAGLNSFRYQLGQLKSAELGANWPEIGEIELLVAVRKFPSRVNNALLPWTTAVQAFDQPRLDSAQN